MDEYYEHKLKSIECRMAARDMETADNLLEFTGKYPTLMIEVMEDIKRVHQEDPDMVSKCDENIRFIEERFLAG